MEEQQAYECTATAGEVPVEGSQLEIDVSTLLSGRDLLDRLSHAEEATVKSIKIFKSTPKDTNMQFESSAKRQRRSSSHAGGRRRGRHLRSYHKEASDDSLPPSQTEIIRILSCHRLLQSLETLTISDVEESIQVQALCRLLDRAPTMKELVLDNIVLFGKVPMDFQRIRSPSSCSCLKRVSLTACGPAEDAFLRWLILSNKSSLQDLSLKQQLLSPATLDMIPRLGLLKKLELDHVPGLHHSNLLDNLCTMHLKELHLDCAFPATWFATQRWKLGSLETLSIAVCVPPQDMGMMLASLIVQHQGSLRNLSVSFLPYKQSTPVHSMWSRFENSLVQVLKHNRLLQSLNIFFSDKNAFNTSERADMNALLERILVKHNSALANLVISNPWYTVQFSPTVQFYLSLNRAGRQTWFQRDQISVEVLANASRVFPQDETNQLSMLVYLLSSHPSFLLSLH